VPSQLTNSKAKGSRDFIGCPHSAPSMPRSIPNQTSVHPVQAMHPHFLEKKLCVVPFQKKQHTQLLNSIFGDHALHTLHNDQNSLEVWHPIMGRHIYRPVPWDDGWTRWCWAMLDSAPQRKNQGCVGYAPHVGQKSILKVKCAGFLKRRDTQLFF
jgi:hypothetical protein